MNLCTVLVVKSGGNNLLEGIKRGWDCNTDICIKKLIIQDSTGSLSVLVADSFEHCNNRSIELLH